MALPAKTSFMLLPGVWEQVDKKQLRPRRSCEQSYVSFLASGDLNKNMLILCLLWLVTTVRGQHLPSPDGACEEGWECRQERHCDPYLDQRDRLERLEKLKGDGDNGVEYQKLSDKLKQLVCNKKEEGVCCKKQLEVVNGKIVEKVGDMPFIVRLKVKTGFSDYSLCGASLIASQFLLSARDIYLSFSRPCGDN